jgi:hypothetical protein
MIGIALAFGSFFTGLSIWWFGVRPYLRQHRRASTSGATWAVSAWADWQECSEFARFSKDSKASALSRWFLLAQAGIIIGIVLFLCRV